MDSKDCTQTSGGDYRKSSWKGSFSKTFTRLSSVMSRTDSRKKILDLERGIDGNQQQNNKKDFRSSRRIPRLLPSRKVGIADLHDKFAAELGDSMPGVQEKQHKDGSDSSCKRRRRSSICQSRLVWLKNNSSYAGFLFLFAATNISLFGSRVWQYRESNVMEMMARAFGQCLNFNCAMVLALILRRSITRLRNSPLGYVLPCDRHVNLHKITGWLVFFCSIFHTIFHLSNFAGLSEVTGISIWSYLLDNKHNIGWAWGMANQTGILLLFFLTIIVVFSHRCIRKSGYFEVFYFTHLLSVAFWALLVLHGRHFWMWLLVPGMIFLTETFLRISQIFSARGKTNIVAAETLPSQVMKLIIQRPIDFEFRAGEYVYLNIPSLAKREWHPFTISSSPEQEESFTVHIRSVGGWTGRVYERFSVMPSQTICRSIFQTHGLIASENQRKKSSSSGDINRYCSSIMEGKLESGDFLSMSDKDVSFENLPTSRYHANLLEFNRKVSTMQPAVLMLENEIPEEKEKLSQRTRKRSSSCSSLNYSDYGQWSPKLLDSGNTSLTGSCSSLQNVGHYQQGSQPSFLQSFAKQHQVSNSSPDLISKNLRRLFKVAPATAIQPVEVYVDGPYGSPSSSICKVNHAILIGAGIGVTPFASILQSIMHKYRAAKLPCPHCHIESCVNMPATLKKLRKVDFIWVNRDVSHFEWFLELLASLEGEQSLAGAAMERFLRLHLYNTGETPLQPSLPLASNVRSGRPDWDKLFTSVLSERTSKTKSAVFYCGPPSLVHVLKVMCHKYKLQFRREMF